MFKRNRRVSSEQDGIRTASKLPNVREDSVRDTLSAPAPETGHRGCGH
jgi:hypothetical protein